MAAPKGHKHYNPSGGFQKGRSGNPGGRPKNDVDVMRIFKANCELAANKLVSLMKNSDDEVLVERICQYIINRVHGRPRESIEVKGDIPSFVALLPAPIDNPDIWEAQAQKLVDGTVEH